MRRRFCLLCAAVLLLLGAGCAGVENAADTSAVTGVEQMSMYLPIPKIEVIETNALPRSEESALYHAAPVGGNPRILFFDEGLVFYFRSNTVPGGEAQYWSGSLTLPDGFAEGKVVHVTSGAGSGEIFVTVEAVRFGRTEYLSYGFFGTEPPVNALLLDEKAVGHLMEMMMPADGTQ